jgi:serine/threonine protein kinase
MNRRDFSDLIELGRGAQSIVYRARQHAMGRTVVLKRMRAENREQRQAAIAHVKALSNATIPASAAIYGLFVHKRDVWIVEEYIEGITLDEARVDSWSDALRFYQAGLLAAALGAVHNAGWAHGDIKPSNILLTVQGDVLFLDFGLARQIRGGGLADDQLFYRAGTLDYLAPEASLPHPPCSKRPVRP